MGTFQESLCFRPEPVLDTERNPGVNQQLSIDLNHLHSGASCNIVPNHYCQVYIVLISIIRPPSKLRK